MSRLSSNSMLMLAEPCREVDEICFTPSTEVTDVLDGVHDVGLHDLGRRALVGHGDVHDGKVDVGVLADAEALERRCPSR